MTQDVRPSNCCAIAHAVSPKIFEEPWPIWIIDSHRRFHKGVTVGNCRMNRLLFPDEMVLHALTFATGSSSRNLEGTKISSKKVEEFCLLRRPRQCFLQVSVKALQQVETFKYLGVVFTSDKCRNKGIDTRICKANAVLHELYCSVVTKRELSKKAKLQFLNRSLFRSSPVVLNLKRRLKEYCQKNKRQRWYICEEFSVWHFVTKSTGLKSVKPRMSRYFSESRDPNYIRSAVCPKCPRKQWRTNTSGYGLHPLESDPKFVQGPGGVAASPTMLATVLMWVEQNYLRLLLIVRCLGSS